MHSTIIKQLDASRRLQEQLKLSRHNQQLQKQKIDLQLQSLKRSRKQFIQSQLISTKNQYSLKLKQDPQVTKQHLQRQKKSQIQRSKIAQTDFQKEREQLIKQRNHYDHIEKDYQLLDREIQDIKRRSKLDYQTEQRKVKQLEIRRKQVVKLLNDSKERQVIHYNRVKSLAA